MDSRKVSVAVVFAALTVALNLSPFKVPAPYAPFLIYQVWEIPIVASFLLFGFQVATLVSVVNTVLLLGIFPGELPTGPFYNLAAVLSMLAGMWMVNRLLESSFNQGKQALHSLTSTVAGALFRVAIMTAVNWIFLPMASPVGFALPMEVVIGYLPLIGVFNATLALYTIPVGHFVAGIADSTMKSVGWSQKQTEKIVEKL